MTLQIATATEQLSATSGLISDDIQAIDNSLRDTLQATDAIAEASVQLAFISTELQTELNQFQYDESQPVAVKQESRESWQVTPSFSGIRTALSQPAAA